MSEETTRTKQLPVPGKDMDSIMENLETGVAVLFTSDRYQEYLRTMAKFHNYSFNNTLLIAMQRPDATLVTSYKNWQSMGRQVMKGEKLNTDSLCSFAGKSVFRHIGRIKADDIVMTFDIRAFPILMKMHICQFAFFIKRHRITVQSIHIKFFS